MPNVNKGYIEPFKIIGNVYFVGCTPASSHLIDTGYADTLFILVDSIHRLGFDVRDIKYISTPTIIGITRRQLEKKGKILRESGENQFIDISFLSVS